MLPRFYAPQAGESGAEVVLSPEESRHAQRVLRLGVGDELAVFDGRGHEWHARVSSIARSTIAVALHTPIESAAEHRVRVILLQAVLKGDHMDAVVRDATMLGVAEIWPVMTSHTVVNPKAASGPGAQARWHRVAVASAKQCRRAVVPVIRAATPVESALQDPAVQSSDTRVLLTEPVMRNDAGEQATAVQTAAVAIGPEGGWARQELEQFAAAGFVPLTLGTLTLRADAAALVALSVLRERWADF